MLLNITNYLIRLFLAYTFIPHGIEKLVAKIDVQEYIAYGLGKPFIDFYLLLESSGYIFFVGFFQLLCGTLLIFKRTYLLGAVMMIPLTLCMLACHVFLSHSVAFMLYDACVLVTNLFLVLSSFTILKQVFLKPQATWI